MPRAHDRPRLPPRPGRDRTGDPATWRGRWNAGGSWLPSTSLWASRPPRPTS